MAELVRAGLPNGAMSCGLCPTVPWIVSATVGLSVALNAYVPGPTTISSFSAAPVTAVSSGQELISVEQSPSPVGDA